MADDRVTPDQELSEDALHRVWQGRLELAERHLQTHGNTGDRWTDNVHALAGDFNSEQELGDEAIDVHMVRSNVKGTLPPLYVSTPYFTVVPRADHGDGSTTTERARFTEIELNYWLQELAAKDEVKEIIYDGEMTNVGYAVVGWVRPQDVEKDGRPVQFSDRIKSGRPFVRRHAPKHTLVPPDFRNLTEAPWVSLVYIKSLLHVQRKYGKRADNVPTMDYTEEWEDLSKVSSSLRTYLKSPDAKLVKLHNIWDKETRKVYVVVENHDKFLEEPRKWPWDLEGLPIERYQPEHIPDEYFGTPPTSYGLMQNKELNSTRTAMRKRRNRTKAVVFMAGEMGDVAQKYAGADDGEIISVGDVDDIRTKVMIQPGLPMDEGDLAYDAVIKSDIRESWGLGAERRGGGDPNVDSATASANIEKGIQIRESDKSDAVRKLWTGIVRKLWMVLKQHPNVERTRLIAGRMAGEYERVKYKLEVLHGEYDFVMNLGTMSVVTPQERMARARINYNLLRTDPLVNAERLVLDVLDAHQVVNPQEYLLRLRTPEEEHAMMLRGLPVEAHERDDHLGHLEEHEQQEEALDQILASMTRGPGVQTPQGMLRIQLAQSLLIAHQQDHMRRLQAITSAQAERAGEPVAENLLRRDAKGQAGQETEAELTGQPLTEAG